LGSWRSCARLSRPGWTWRRVSIGGTGVADTDMRSQTAGQLRSTFAVLFARSSCLGSCRPAGTARTAISSATRQQQEDCHIICHQGCIEKQPTREEDEPIIEKDDAFCPLNSLEDFDLGTINKAMAEDILADKRQGTFLVRWSERQIQFVISVKQNFHCGHHLVTRQEVGGREGRHSPPGQPPAAAPGTQSGRAGPDKEEVESSS